MSLLKEGSQEKINLSLDRSLQVKKPLTMKSEGKGISKAQKTAGSPLSGYLAGPRVNKRSPETDSEVGCAAPPAFLPFEDSMVSLVEILSSPALTWDLAFLGRIPSVHLQYCFTVLLVLYSLLFPLSLWVYALKKSLCHSFGKFSREQN